MIDVIIVAAGSGSRLGATIPKAFVELNNKAMLSYSLELFESCDYVNNVIVVVPRDYIEKTKELIKTDGLVKVSAIVPGGKERNDSVANGFEHLHPGADYVLIHDAARPLLTQKVVNSVIEALQSYKASFPAVPAVDTIKVVNKDNMEVLQTLDRSKLFCVQTPQAFSVDMIPILLKKASETGLAYDEAMLLEGVCPIKVVDGDYENFKITGKSDLAYAEFLLKKEAK